MSQSDNEQKPVSNNRRKKMKQVYNNFTRLLLIVYKLIPRRIYLLCNSFFSTVTVVFPMRA